MHLGTRARQRRWLYALGQSLSLLVVAVIVGFTVNHFRPGRLPLVGDWSPAAELKVKDTGESLVVSLEDAEAMFLSHEAVFIDARPEDTYRLGHIEGARNLPLDEVDSRFAEVMADVAPGAAIITYCDGEGCELSKDLAFALLEKGYPNVKVLLNGWSVWQQNGLPIDK